VAELSDLVQGELQGDGAGLISGVASLEGAHPAAVCFLGNPKFREAGLAAPARGRGGGGALPPPPPPHKRPPPHPALL
jgi:hypothetical protein